MEYQALADRPPNIRKDRIYNFNDPLIPEYQKLFGPVNENGVRTDHAGKDIVADKVGFRGPDGNTNPDDGGQQTNADPHRIDGGGNILTVNPSRDDLKSKATDLGIQFASNIPTDRLVELIAEAEAAKSKQE